VVVKACATSYQRASLLESLLLSLHWGRW